MEMNEFIFNKNSQYSVNWMESYVDENPWDNLAIDLDSLVLFYMKNYLQKNQDSPQIFIEFFISIENGKNLMIRNMIKECIFQLNYLLNFLTIKDIYWSIISTNKFNIYTEIKEILYNKIRKLKKDLTDENNMNILRTYIFSYMLLFKDDIKNKLISYIDKGFFSNNYHIKVLIFEDEDIYANTFKLIISENLELLFFKNIDITIIKPFFYNSNIPWEIYEYLNIDS